MPGKTWKATRDPSARPAVPLAAHSWPESQTTCYKSGKKKRSEEKSREHAVHECSLGLKAMGAELSVLW